jgi:L-ascorbate metabolism protein UlaG (beta-lactamase superfamily)
VKVRLLRNATLLLESSVGRILVDPMLRPARSSPPIEDTPNPQRNPLVELPMPVDEILDGVDLCIVTHLHRDHFDDLIPLDLPILTQPESAEALRARGFTNVSTSHPAIAMTRGRHGTGEVGRAMGAVSGWVVDGVYVAGDTILCDEVHEAIARHEPRVTIVNAGGARFLEGEPITMTSADVARVVDATPHAVVVAVHLEAVNHCLETRAELRAALGGRVLVPEDGEMIELGPLVAY